MKQIMEINVTIFQPRTVEGSTGKAVMIPFSAENHGELFCGCTREEGVDTQRILPDGSMTLSARYILYGRDADGRECSLFIENNGTSLENCTPKVITDSPALGFLETTPLSAKVEPCENGVVVRIFA